MRDTCIHLEGKAVDAAEGIGMTKNFGGNVFGTADHQGPFRADLGHVSVFCNGRKSSLFPNFGKHLRVAGIVNVVGCFGGFGYVAQRVEAYFKGFG